MKYNYWVIYILPDYINDVSAFKPYENDYVYAFTDSEDILNNFISFHNMSKFVVKKYKFDRNECRTLNTKYQNRYLRLIEITTGKNGKVEYIKLAMSIEEKNLLDNTKYSFMWKISNIWDVMTFELRNPTLNIFNKKYKKILKKFKFHEFIVHNKHPKNIDKAFNEFAIYYSLFNNLLK